ncbi:MAG: CoB--CoM heterodisulfide reductase iron-sulfur subunit B family protein [Lachnospiraceae bacterium]|nr:CoB--CoM heterodisulfide reductase iron-sulfur subunit B family protein [Lachnospiraceae bacterium]
MKYSYFPGCTLSTHAKKLDSCARESAKVLGIELEELPEWQCCGGVYPIAKDEIATRLSSVRALAEAKKRGNKLVTLCSACYNVIKRVNLDIQRDEEIRSKVNNYLQLDEPYDGSCEVVHFTEILRDEIGFEELAKRVKNPLTGKKIGAYYGCLLLRPGSELAFDDPENPKILEDLIAALGAEPVYFAYRNECCGGYMTVSDRALASKMAQQAVDNARASAPDCLITACPLCMYNLSKNTDGGLPIIYFTELLAQCLT